MVEAIRQFREFTHGRLRALRHGRRPKSTLEELVTGREMTCICSSGYGGKPGELWYVRLCPPLADLAEYHVAMTTPYILTAGDQDRLDGLSQPGDARPGNSG